MMFMICVSLLMIDDGDIADNLAHRTQWMMIMLLLMTG